MAFVVVYGLLGTQDIVVTDVNGQEVGQTAVGKETPADESIALPWSLLILLIFLSGTACVSALYSYRLTVLRLNSNDGKIISFDDSFRDWLAKLERHYENSQKMYSDHADKMVLEIGNVSQELETQTSKKFEELVEVSFFLGSHGDRS